MNAAVLPTGRLLTRAPIALLVVAGVAVLVGFTMRRPDADLPSLAFLDRYIDAVPWTLALLAAPFLVILLVVMLQRPVLVVYGLAVLLPLNVVGKVGGGAVLTLEKILVNLLFFVSLLTLMVAPRAWFGWLRGSRLGLSLAAFSGVLGFEAIVGYVAGYDLYEWMRELVWLSFFLFAFPVAVFVHTRRQMATVLGLLALGSVVGLVQSLVYFTTASRFQRAEDWVGGASFLRAPFSEGMRFVLLWLIVIVYVQWPARRLRPLTTAAIGGLGLSLAIGMLAGLARSMWLTTIVGVVVAMALSPRSSRTRLVVPLVAAAVLVALAGVQWLDSLSASSSGHWLSDAIGGAVGGNILGALTRGDAYSSTLGREVEWRNAIRLWLESPFIGNGIGAPFEKTIYSDPSLAAFFTHNSYLNVLAKTGLAGLTAFAVLIVQVVAVLRRIRRSTEPFGGTQVLAIAMMAYLVSVLIHTFGAATITTTDTVMFLALMIGMTIALGRLEGFAPLADDSTGPTRSVPEDASPA